MAAFGSTDRLVKWEMTSRNAIDVYVYLLQPRSYYTVTEYSLNITVHSLLLSKQLKQKHTLNGSKN